MSKAEARRRTLRGLGVVAALSCLLGGAATADARLSFTRADGSAIVFRGKPHAWCGPWERDVARRSVHVELTNKKRRWQLSAVRRDAEVGEPLTFPNDFVWNKPRGAQLFVAYAANEASTSTEDSSGSMTFSHVSCRRDGLVAFEIDAVVGSELFDGKPVRVSGTYRGRVARRP